MGPLTHQALATAFPLDNGYYYSDLAPLVVQHLCFYCHPHRVMSSHFLSITSKIIEISGYLTLFSPWSKILVLFGF